MKREPEPVPASVAHSFRKDVVVIMSLDRSNGMTHTTTWGRTAQDKLTAAEWGDQFAALLCGPNAPRTTFEDFRTIDAAATKARFEKLQTVAREFLEWVALNPEAETVLRIAAAPLGKLAEFITTTTDGPHAQSGAEGVPD